MNLGVIHWGFPPRGGGVEAHLITVLPEVVKLGTPVFVLTETMEGQKAEDTVEGVKIIRVEGLSSSKLDQRIKKGENLYDSSKKLFDEFIDKNKIDVIQAHNIHMDYFDLARALMDSCLERGIPCYPVLHNHEFIDRDEETMKKILREIKWTKIVSISRFIGKAIKKKIPEVPAEKWEVIPHGINLENFKPIDSKEKDKIKKEYGFSGKRVILHPARILRWKGIIPAIRAMPKIAKKIPDAILVLTGRIKPIFKEQGEIKKYNLEVDEIIKQLKIESYMHIGKYVYKDIPRLTSISDVVIYTTIGDEPFGLCPVEAMACKVPQVVTASGGLVESVVDGITGYVISKDESKIPEELGESIIKILLDSSLAKKMGEAGRKRAEEIFSKTRMAKDFIALSQKLLKEAKRS